MNITIDKLIEELEQELKTGDFKYLTEVNEYGAYGTQYIKIYANTPREANAQVAELTIPFSTWSGDFAEYYDENANRITEDFISSYYSMNKETTNAILKELDELFERIINKKRKVVTIRSYFNNNIKDALEALRLNNFRVVNREALHEHVALLIKTNDYDLAIQLLKELNEYKNVEYFKYDFMSKPSDLLQPLDENHKDLINELLTEMFQKDDQMLWTLY